MIFAVRVSKCDRMTKLRAANAKTNDRASRHDTYLTDVDKPLVVS